MSSRTYDLVLLGATGFTGTLTAEHITQHLPTDLKWAISGRSKQKLAAVNDELTKLNPSRSAPAVEVTSLTKDELIPLANKTKVLINTVGPYHKYSTPVVEACAETGTHYLDVTGENPWVKDMIAKYHDVAKKSGAIVIPQCGIESAPADVLTYVVATHLRKKTGKAVREVVISLARFTANPSGGTLATVFSIFDSYGGMKLAQASAPSAYLPPTAKLASNTSSARGFLGIRRVTGLGTLALPLLSSVDIPVVQRTWALLQDSKQPDAYGSEFRFNTYSKARNWLFGLLINFAAIVGPLTLAFPPIRWLIRPFVTQPGSGPSKEVEARGEIVQEALATADDSAVGRATGTMRWKGGMYMYTGVLVAEAAATIIYNRDTIAATKMGGGLCTPATLGEAYVERLKDRGVKIDAQYLEK